MTRDVYAWIDPFEEAARADAAQVQYQYAREQGQKDVMDMIAREGGREMFIRRLENMVGAMCEKIAYDVVRPAMERMGPYEDFARRLNEVRLRQLDLARPAMTFITQMAKFELGVGSFTKRSITFSETRVRVVEPFEVVFRQEV